MKPVNTLFYRLLCAAFAAALLVACQEHNTPNGPDEPVNPKDTVVSQDTLVPVDTLAADLIPQLDSMTLREKVGQLFNIRLENLNDGKTVQEGNDRIRSQFAEYPCGGFTLYSKNIATPTQLTQLTTFLHSLGAYPMLCIDEEGGTVARIANTSTFSVTKYKNMYTIGQTGNPENAYEAGSTIGAYLTQYGLDVDFAPVADVWTNPDNTVIGKRSFSSDPQVVASMTIRFYEGLSMQHIVGCYKHFPGHGNTSTDTHYGYASTEKTWVQMQTCELIPFAEGIKNGIDMIMVAHISAPQVTGNDDPATVSYTLISDKLRGEMGFQGVVVTDGMEMGAITNQFSASEAAIRAIQAGVDIVLLPADYKTAFDAVVAAVENGSISEERINESVLRVLCLKKQILSYKGLILRS